MPFVQAGGLKLYYESHGEGEPLLCIGGVAIDVTGWRPQIPPFSRHFRTVVFDNRDVGRSDYVNAAYEVGDLVGDTLALADALGLERFHSLGISMGGAVAQELALAAPERVSSLTLCVSYATTSRWEHERTRLQLLALERMPEEERIDTLMVSTLSEESYDAMGEQAHAMRDLVLAQPHRQRRDGYVRQLEASATHAAGDRLGQLRLPVHVIGAELDLLVPVWKSRELAGLIPGAALTVIAGAAHAVNLERVHEFNEAVLGFLLSVSAGAPAPRR
jgi:3-oxoadipate enol-lactonase